MKYKTILADPPWPYNSPKAIVGNGGRGSLNAKNIIQVDVERHYDTMTLEAIQNLQIEERCEANFQTTVQTIQEFIQ